jgi:protocatechuate 3,4-dioxygenase beta subunit
VPTGGNGTADFGDLHTGTVSGKVFNDINGDGVQGTDEPGIAGVSVALIDSAGIAAGPPVGTDGSGAFAFSGLAPGNYTVKETDPAGYVSTTDNVLLVSVPSGGAAVANFGDRRTATVAGIVFDDINGDGIQSMAETGIPDVTVTLTDSDGNIKTAKTGTDGAYLFENVTPGVYKVKETDPADYVSTTANEVTVTVPAGGIGTANFGDRETATLGGTVYNDANGNGVQDAGEKGIGGAVVTVTLTDGSGNETITVTDSDGIYLFANLAPGSYTVKETDPAGFTSTANQVTVNIPSGGAGSANFGDREANTISGRVFNDLNGSTGADANEPGIFNVKIELIGADGTTVVATTYTGGDGAYNFSSVTPGTYTVRETNPDGYASTNPVDDVLSVSLSDGGTARADFGDREVGIITGTVFNDIDKNGTKGTGEASIAAVTVQLFISSDMTTPIATAVTDISGNYSFHNLAAKNYTVKEIDLTGYSSTTLNEVAVTLELPPVGTGTGTANFGDLQGADISGTVFNDANGNMTQDHDEPGIPGVTITLTDSSGKETTVTTDAAGDYIFNDVVAGTYTVKETDLADYSSTTLNEVLVTAPSGGAVTADFGDRAADSIGGIVFADRDGDRVQDPEESGIPGVTVTLSDKDGNQVTTTTGADGSYTFTGVKPGDYTVEETNLLPYKSTTDDIKSVTMTAGTSLTVNFGDRQENKLIGAVFNDLNGDRLQGPGEPGISGVGISLADMTGIVFATAVTGADGTYKFENLEAGTYLVKETDPAGWISTTDNTLTAAVPPGGVGNADFGDHQIGLITCKVFNDINADGVQQPGEPGISDATVTLFDSSGKQISTAIANADGSYSFNVSPGSYTVKETDPAGYISTTNNMKMVSVPTGGAGIANFGDRKVGTVGGIVYDDVNGNRLQDAGESGISGVTVQLCRDAQPCVSTLTDPYGIYIFKMSHPELIR